MASRAVSFPVFEGLLTENPAPLQNIVEYSITTFDHVMFHPDEQRSIFQGKRRPELDAAWADIMNRK